MFQRHDTSVGVRYTVAEMPALPLRAVLPWTGLSSLLDLKLLHLFRGNGCVEEVRGGQTRLSLAPSTQCQLGNKLPSAI